MIVLAGEALIDLAPRGEQLLPLPGGSPYNVAIGLGRLGRDAHYLGGVSRDAFGRGLAARLEAEGVGLDLVVWTDAPTTLAVVHLDEESRATYGFYLDATSVVALDDDHLPRLPDGAALHVSFGAIAATHDPTGRALARLLRSEHTRRFTSLDPNVRPSVIDDLAAYRAVLDELAPAVDLLKVSDEDLAVVAGPGSDPLDLARSWATRGPALVVVTLGTAGARALRPDGTEVSAPGRSVAVVDTVGAGDAFTSGMLAWLDRAGCLERTRLAACDDAALAEALGLGVHVAAITCTRAGSDPPRTEELG